jgi:hypothetical protein
MRKKSVFENEVVAYHDASGQHSMHVWPHLGEGGSFCYIGIANAVHIGRRADAPLGVDQRGELVEYRTVPAEPDDCDLTDTLPRWI